MDGFRFTLNGAPVTVRGWDPHVTLLEYLRATGLTGAKEGCAEGECGACAVALLEAEPGGVPAYRAVQSCLLLLPTVAGREVWTVEGLARGDRLHPVQEALVRHGASQCGYCTPGFVMSLFAEYYRPGREGFDPEAMSGNLCRCTGYRPLRDAARELGPPAPDDPFLLRLGQAAAAGPPAGADDEAGAGPARPGPQSPGVTAPAPAGPAPPAYGVGEARFYRPRSLSELLRLLAAEPRARLVAGGTDLAVERNLRHVRWPVLVSLADVPELHELRWQDGEVEIGAAVALSRLEEVLGGRLPLLEQLLPLFASRPIRNRATLGGNLATASPIGDAAPVLLTLDAAVRLVSVQGERTLPLREFFTGYRQTALAPGEVLAAVRIPRPFPAYGRFYKVAKRSRDDISTVAAAFALDLAAGGQVVRVRLAYGGVAPTPVRVVEAEQALAGSRWEPAALKAAEAALERELEPIGDHRGSAAYRKALVRNLLERFFWETQEVAVCAP